MKSLLNYNGEVICCWNGGLDVARMFNGIARVVRYGDKEIDGEKPDYMIAMWEGHVRYGVPYGFTRLIQGFFTSEAFIGYLRDLETTMKGIGIYMVKEKVTYSGMYEDGTKYRLAKPKEISGNLEIKDECANYYYRDEATGICKSAKESCKFT